jgi:hypothetical protein
MPDYDPDRACLKCGSPCVGTEYVSFSLSSGGDALRRKCDRCGYAWLELPLPVELQAGLNDDPERRDDSRRDP